MSRSRISLKCGGAARHERRAGRGGGQPCQVEPLGAQIVAGRRRGHDEQVEPGLGQREEVADTRADVCGHGSDNVTVRVSRETTAQLVPFRKYHNPPDA